MPEISDRARQWATTMAGHGTGGVIHSHRDAGPRIAAGDTVGRLQREEREREMLRRARPWPVVPGTELVRRSRIRNAPVSNATGTVSSTRRRFDAWPAKPRSSSTPRITSAPDSPMLWRWRRWHDPLLPESAPTSPSPMRWHWGTTAATALVGMPPNRPSTPFSPRDSITGHGAPTSAWNRSTCVPRPWTGSATTPGHAPHHSPWRARSCRSPTGSPTVPTTWRTPSMRESSPLTICPRWCARWRGRIGEPSCPDSSARSSPPHAVPEESAWTPRLRSHWPRCGPSTTRGSTLVRSPWPRPRSSSRCCSSSSSTTWSISTWCRRSFWLGRRTGCIKSSPTSQV